MKSVNYLNSFLMITLFSVNLAIGEVQGGTTETNTTNVQVRDTSSLQTTFPVIIQNENGSSSSTSYTPGTSAAMNVHKNAITTLGSSNNHALTQLPTDGSAVDPVTPPADGGGSSASAQNIADLLNEIASYDFGTLYDNFVAADQPTKQSQYDAYEIQYFETRGYVSDMSSDGTLKSEVETLAPTWNDGVMSDFNSFMTRIGAAM